MKFWNVSLEKMSSFIYISFTGILPSGQAFLVLRVLIISFPLSIETGWKRKEEIFFDFTISLILAILGWYRYLMIQGFIKSTDYRPTDHRPRTHRPTDPIILFKRLGNRKIFILQNTHTAENVIQFIIYCVWWIIFAFIALNICKGERGCS